MKLVQSGATHCKVVQFSGTELGFRGGSERNLHSEFEGRDDKAVDKKTSTKVGRKEKEQEHEVRGEGWGGLPPVQPSHRPKDCKH